MAELWLVRHGETEWSLAGRHTGRTDLPLTAHGEEQAKDLRRRLAGKRFAQVRTSPLKRARQTCELAGYGDQARADPNLMEWDYGQYEGKTSSEIHVTAPGWTLWDAGVPGGESSEQVAQRADRVIADLAGEKDAVALFAHGHFLRVLAARWVGLEPSAGRYLLLEPTSVCILGKEHEQPVLKIWNEISAS